MSAIPEIKGEYSPTFKRINVGGIFGGISPAGIEASIFTQEKVIDKVVSSEPPNPSRIVIKRVIEFELILDPLEMKSIHKWLGEKIKEYERIFGVIPSPEEIESRQRRES